MIIRFNTYINTQVRLKVFMVEDETMASDSFLHGVIVLI